MAKNKKKFGALKIFLIISVIIFAILGLGLIAVSPYLATILSCRKTALEIAANSKKDDFRSTETSMVYDINGDLLTTISGAVDMHYIEYDDIPEVVRQGFILTEDRKFRNHIGIDFFGIVRSMIANMRSNGIVQGASTITQQLARNVYLTQDVTYERKFTEMFLAMELEKKYTKNQLLEFYINNIYYANSYYGIEAAAEGYFSKPVSELSVSQLAFLVGIPKNPSKYNPVEHFDRAVERRDYILYLLNKFGYLSDEDYDTALDEEIVLSRPEKTDDNYVKTYIFYCATRALMAKNGFVFRYEFETDEEAEEYYDLYDYYYSKYQLSLFTGGYRIYTSIDMDKQEYLQLMVDNELAPFSETNDEGIYKMQAAAVCIDNSNGYVTAIVGGRDQDLPGYTLNRAYQSYRQSGSSIKPLNVYAPFLMKGHNPSYVVDDSPMENGPVNNDEHYLGSTTIQDALAWSSNVVAWKLYAEMTPEYGLSFLRKMHFKRLCADDNYLATALGGFTNGVSAVEMAAGFATLANDGKYRDPTCIMRITDKKGFIIVDNTLRDEFIYDMNASRMISKILQYGVEEGLASDAQIDGLTVAIKTGTTNNNRDGWSIGYSMYYTTAVWVGMDMPEPVPELTGGSYPLYIWKGFMEEIHKGLEDIPFPAYTEYYDPSQIKNNSANGGGSGSGGGSGGGYYDGDADAQAGGDADANGGIGDADAPTRGDADANSEGGDKDAPIGGDVDANGEGGDKDAPVGGDADAPVGGDADANIEGGDKDAPVGGDADAPAGSGDVDAPVGGDTDA